MLQNLASETLGLKPGLISIDPQNGGHLAHVCASRALHFRPTGNGQKRTISFSVTTPALPAALAMLVFARKNAVVAIKKIVVNSTGYRYIPPNLQTAIPGG